MTISYAGISLLQTDADALLSDWMQQFQTLDDLQVWCEKEVGVETVRNSPNTTTFQQVGIGLPNYPPAPAPRLNTYYNPTGATRFGRCYVLANFAMKRRLEALCHPSGYTRAKLLRMGDPAQTLLQTEMFMLPARPVTIFPPDQLWLVPLVDERYWWQFQNIGDITINLESTTPPTWYDIFVKLGSDLGVDLGVGENDIPITYLYPDPTELTRKYNNAAVMLDVVTHALQRRVVRQTNGSYSIEDGSNDPITNNLKDKWWQIAGGKFNSPTHGDIPKNVTTVFSQWANHHPFCKGKYTYTKDIGGDKIAGTGAFSSAFSSAYSQGGDTTKTFFSTLYADYSTDSITADNAAVCNALAIKIAEDYRQWFDYRYDYTFAGCKHWTMSGFDNWYEFSFGRQIDGKQLAQTRISSMPPNYGIEQNLSQSIATGTNYDDIVFGKLTVEIDPDTDKGKLRQQVYNNETFMWEATTDNEINIYDFMELGIKVGDKVIVAWSCKNNKWVIIASEVNPSVIGYLTTPLLAENKATLSIWKINDDLTTEDTGLTCDVYDWLLINPNFLNTGSKIIAVYNSHSKKFIVTATQC